MLKSELVEYLAKRARISEESAEDIITLIFHSFTQSLKRRERIEIRGFGAFYVKQYAAYTGRNPKTGHKIQVAPKLLPCWRTGLELRRRIELAHQRDNKQSDSKFVA